MKCSIVLLSLAIIFTGCTHTRKGVVMEKKCLKIVDEKGTTRVVISFKLPNPVVGGIERPRDVTVSGIQLNDENGNEIGGFGAIEGMRASLFALIA